MKILLFAASFLLTFCKGHAQIFSNPDALFDPAPYGFSHIATVPGNSRLVFIAGQGGEENKEGKLSRNFEAQVQQALRTLKQPCSRKA
jgi:enamine deaminase RidA (YjgF/YER057c/UK114 family)